MQGHGSVCTNPYKTLQFQLILVYSTAHLFAHSSLLPLPVLLLILMLVYAKRFTPSFPTSLLPLSLFFPCLSFCHSVPMNNGCCRQIRCTRYKKTLQLPTYWTVAIKFHCIFQVSKLKLVNSRLESGNSLSVIGAQVEFAPLALT